VGRKLTPAEEYEQLAEIVRQAHEVLGDLRREIRAAARLAPTLTRAFEEHADREIKQLSNHLTANANQASAELNQHICELRRQITEQLNRAEIVHDGENGTVGLLFNTMRFEDNVPPPFPDVITPGDPK
jgi:F0F1-type ATP synthase membrane subunit b/b'